MASVIRRLLRWWRDVRFNEFARGYGSIIQLFPTIRPYRRPRRLTNRRLAKLARKKRPPREWYDEDFTGLM